MDEVVRALHWHRIASPYRAGIGFVKLDDEILTDEWIFRQGETWYSETVGQLVKQGAPARISRNIELPKVKINGDKPFVFAGRFPNGAVAIGAQERTRAGHRWFIRKAEVTLEVSDSRGPFGIFGHFSALTLQFPESLRGVHVLAQDLMGGDVLDVTERGEIHGLDLHLPGPLIEEVGLGEATSGDVSDSGMILKLV